MINSNIGKVYYHFIRTPMDFDTAAKVCSKFGFGVDLPIRDRHAVENRRFYFPWKVTLENNVFQSPPFFFGKEALVYSFGKLN